MASSVYSSLGLREQVETCSRDDLVKRSEELKNYLSSVSVVGHNARKMVNKLNEDAQSGKYNNYVEPLVVKDSEQVYVGILNGQCYAAFNIGKPDAEEFATFHHLISKTLEQVKHEGIYNVSFDILEPHYFGVRNGKVVSNGVFLIGTPVSNIEKVMTLMIDAMQNYSEFKHVDFYRDTVLDTLMNRRLVPSANPEVFSEKYQLVYPSAVTAGSQVALSWLIHTPSRCLSSAAPPSRR